MGGELAEGVQGAAVEVEEGAAGVGVGEEAGESRGGAGFEVGVGAGGEGGEEAGCCPHLGACSGWWRWFGMRSRFWSLANGEIEMG